MNDTTLDHANNLKTRIRVLKNMKTRLENQAGNYRITFGVSIQDPATIFMPISEDKLTEELSSITLKYCNDTIVQLEAEYENLHEPGFRT